MGDNDMDLPGKGETDFEWTGGRGHGAGMRGSGREGKEFEDRQLELRAFVEWYGNLVQ